MGAMRQIHSVSAVSVCQMHTYMLQRRVRSPLSKNFPGAELRALLVQRYKYWHLQLKCERPVFFHV
jgi:hypothetical protein